MRGSIVGRVVLVVVKYPSSSVVTIMIPESVTISPSESVVQVEVKVVQGLEIVDVMVVREPSSSVVTITTPILGIVQRLVSISVIGRWHPVVC